MTTTAPPLSAELEVGLRRLKLSTVRRLAPELMLTAQDPALVARGLLASLIEAEVGARDASNAAARLKAANFPVKKTPGTQSAAVLV